MSDRSDCDGGWVTFVFFLFFIILLAAIPFWFYRSADNCGRELPAERYAYRPADVGDF